MKALVYTNPKQLTYKDVEDPIVTDGNHLVRIDSVGICGSDMHAFLGHDERRPSPLILGHEAAGVIVGGIRNGERVTINPLVACEACDACLSGRDNICADRQLISIPPYQGAFAELVSIPDKNLVTVPTHVPLHKAALVEPIACGWHTIKLALATVNKDQKKIKVLVIGGGAIGLGTALSFQALGINNVTMIESNIIRLEYLKKHCNQNVLLPDVLKNNSDFDIVVDGVGYEATRRMASAQVRPGGVIAHIGLGSPLGGLDIRRMTLQEITFIGTYTYTSKDFLDTATAIFNGQLGHLNWTDARHLSDGKAAFDEIKNGLVMAPKIILKP
jgi:L-iditol 2-dehydrogenase